MLILLDMDGVLADFAAGFYQAWAQGFSELHPPIAMQHRKNFYVRDDYPRQLARQIETIYHQQYFYRDLPVMDGAKEAVATMLEEGHDVRICTSPLVTNRFCASEKFEWVEMHLGRDFLNRIIIAKDKTWVRGDVLIDDKPLIKGSLPPVWQHVVYDQPYNREAKGPRLTWSNWQEVLKTL